MAPETDKEKEILERQRRLAAQLRPGSKNDPIDLTGGGGAPKRPSHKRPSGGKAAILAAARAKAQTSTEGVARKIPSKPKDTKPSPKLVRKTVNPADAANAASSLANLVKHASTTEEKSSQGFTNYTPDDFWRNLRDWDFVRDYAKVYIQNDTNEAPSTTTRQVPDEFINANHYISTWAPLCLAECRAQLVQEATLNMTQPILVKVKSSASERKVRASDTVDTWTNENMVGGYIKLFPVTPRQKMDIKANDVCLLLKKEHSTLLKGIKSGRITTIPEDCGFIGQTETKQDEVDGLVLKVSKQKWARLGEKEMHFVHLGSNITALREFTALCRMEVLPLSKYLYAQHLRNPDNRRKLSRHQSKEQLIGQIGGAQALGEGFAKYAGAKFNQSQLAAIAASAHQYGEGGFTLIKGPPGTGKTTTLVAVLNSLHIRQYNKYFDEVRKIATNPSGTRHNALEAARKHKPRLLVCAPSNAAVDNIILKIMEDGFIDGNGNRYNPSMVRVGVGRSHSVQPVYLDTQVDNVFSEYSDIAKVDTSIAGYKIELSRIQMDIAKLRKRMRAITQACSWPLSRDWEIRVDETNFDQIGRVFFVNHKDKTTTYEVPPPPEPGEPQYSATSMPEYRSYLSRIVKLVESYYSIKTHLERCTIIKAGLDNGLRDFQIRFDLETHILNSVHMVMTTLGTAGNRALESADKFEVVVVDEAAQSVEPATLAALHLGSRHAVLVGDPQQLPATIFNVSGRNSKYDRSLFQRLEEAGQPVYMLNLQYRMAPAISHFPRHIFYGGTLLDGPNVLRPEYGNPMKDLIVSQVPKFRPFLIFDLDSKEEKGGTSLSNAAEAQLALYLFERLKELSHNLSTKSKIAVITPYADQRRLLHRTFEASLGPRYNDYIEINTVDGFQGREANVVIFSAVRAAGSSGIGFLSDVRRMNVALTRAKHFLLVIARCKSIVVNPYWRDLVTHARETKAVLRVPLNEFGGRFDFGDLRRWEFEEGVNEATANNGIPQVESTAASLDPRKRKRT